MFLGRIVFQLQCGNKSKILITFMTSTNKKCRNLCLCKYISLLSSCVVNEATHLTGVDFLTFVTLSQFLCKRRGEFSLPRFLWSLVFRCSVVCVCVNFAKLPQNPGFDLVISYWWMKSRVCNTNHYVLLHKWFKFLPLGSSINCMLLWRHHGDPNNYCIA